MKSVADARNLVEQHRDPFYLTAFMIGAWLGEVALTAAAQYAENKKPKDRALQTGNSWCAFQQVFGHATDAELPHVMQSVYRFCEYDDVQAEQLRRAIVPLSFEHECFHDYVGRHAPDMQSQPQKAVQLLRRSMERWCDWIDAVFHFNTHFHYHVLPESFDPDPERRELAALGTLQRTFPELPPFSREWWEWHHREAAERFKNSHKWQTIGKLAAAPLRNAPAPVDEVVILLWPLVKKYNWTYRDLMAVVRQGLPGPHAYPLEREQDLAAYCSNVLGLRKHGTAAGVSSLDGRPKGCEVAWRLLARPKSPKSS